MVEVTIYTKRGCHLCDEVKVMLGRLTAVYPHHLTEIDISQDTALFDRYRYTIPVLHIGAAELQAPITISQLKDALKKGQ